MRVPYRGRLVCTSRVRLREIHQQPHDFNRVVKWVIVWRDPEYEQWNHGGWPTRVEALFHASRAYLRSRDGYPP